MRKALLLVLGFILIGVLSYVCFIDKASTIQKNLMAKTEKHPPKDKNSTLEDTSKSPVVIVEKTSSVIVTNTTNKDKNFTVEDTSKSAVVIVEKASSSVKVPTTIVVKKSVASVEEPIAIKPILSQTAVPISTVKPVESVAVPVAIKTVDVPVPVQVVTAPVAIQLEDENKKIEVNTKGVK